MKTKSHLVFSRGQTRARPAQGGAFAAPVGPANATPYTGMTLSDKPRSLGVDLGMEAEATHITINYFGVAGPTTNPLIPEAYRHQLSRRPHPAMVEPTFPLGPDFVVNVDTSQVRRALDEMKRELDAIAPAKPLTFADLPIGARFHFDDEDSEAFETAREKIAADRFAYTDDNMKEQGADWCLTRNVVQVSP